MAENYFDRFDSAPSPYAGAISSIESGGNYRAIGPDTGKMGRALGKYQVMSENVGPWSKEVLGREITPREFINNPELQDAIFNGKFGQYVDKYGPDGAARAWFAGEQGMKNPNAKDAFGTTVSEYSRRFNKALGLDARAAVDQFAPDAPQMMAFSGQDKPAKMSAAKPEAKNFFDQFDEAAAPASPASPATPAPAATGPTAGLTRVVITGPEKTAPELPAAAGADRGALDAAARGVAQGFTANFGDEIRGLVEASGANPDDPASVYKLLAGALKYWAGDAEAKQRYDAAVKRERELNKTAEEQHPVATIAGNVGGAVLLPLGAGAGAATLGGRMAAGAGTGAVLGGAAGAGEGEGVVDSLSRAAVGAGAGGILGGAAPAVIEGVVRGARAAVRPIANAIRGVRNVDDEAARRVVTVLERDQAIDPQAAGRLTPNEFAASVQGGGPARLIDIGGENTRALARSAANTSPEGRAVMNRAINDRFEGQTGRVVGWLRNTFHFPDAEAQAHAIREVARDVNRPNYARAMRDGEAGVWDAELQRLAGAPAIQEAARGAIPSLANRGITEGFRAPRTNPLVFDRQTGQASLRTTPDGVRTIPDLRFWDQVKRNIDAMISKAERYGDTAKVEELTQLNQRLVAHLDTRVESYAAARAGAAHFFGAQDALEAGQNFVGRNMSASEARRALAQMTPQERQLFQDGFVSRFIETLNQVGDRRTILNKIADSPAAREKLAVALGPGRAAELEAGLRVEGIMDLARNAVQGNSTTARQLAELGLAGGAYGFSGGVSNPFDPGAVMNAAIVYGAARGKNAINERLSRRVAEMLVSNDPRTITRGIQTIARNQMLFNSLRSADRGLARISGEQSGGFPAVQAVGVGRAEDQPNGPRPSR